MREWYIVTLTHTLSQLRAHTRAMHNRRREPPYTKVASAAAPGRRSHNLLFPALFTPIHCVSIADFVQFDRIVSARVGAANVDIRADRQRMC